MGSSLPIAKEAKRQDMYEAAERGDVRTLQHYLDEGMSPNTFVRPESPRFMWIVRRLDGDAKDFKYFSRPVILGAADSGNVRAVQLLLDQGADINACAPDGMTALMSAAYENNKPMTQLLLQRGADPYCCWKDGSLAESKDAEIQTLLNSAQKSWCGSKTRHRGTRGLSPLP